MTKNALATVAEKKPLNIYEAVGARYGMEPTAFVHALKGTWQSEVRDKITDPQIAAFLVVCDQYKLNPLTKEIYAFPSKGGAIVPMLGIDGWISIANAHPEFDGQEWKDIVDGNSLVAVECTIWRKDRSRPTTVREYLKECLRSTDPWKQSPARMLRHRAFMQCARYAFGFSGLAMEGDIIDGEVLEITPQAGDVVGQVVPTARQLALQKEDESIAASAERAKEARAKKEAEQNDQQGQQASGATEDAKASAESPSSTSAGPEPEAAGEGEGGDADDPRWNIVDQIMQLLDSSGSIAEFHANQKASKEDFDALPEGMQATVRKESSEAWATLLAATAKNDPGATASWICGRYEKARNREAMLEISKDTQPAYVAFPPEVQKLVDVAYQSKSDSFKAKI